jgi:hypothetical protein
MHSSRKDYSGYPFKQAHYQFFGMAGKQKKMQRIYQKPEACRYSFVFSVCPIRRTFPDIPFSEDNGYPD